VIEFIAVTQPPDPASEPAFMARFAHSRIHRSPGLFMKVAGTRLTGEFFFDDPRLTLVCFADLTGPLPSGESPASLIAGLYLQHGDKFAGKLSGSFGIVLYDHEQKQLKAWTDHFGIRRIVYGQTRAGVAVGSDLRLLLPYIDPPDIDPAAILEYLQYSCIPAPRTIYRSCFRLEPGHCLATKPSPASRAYWDMSYRVIEGKSEEYWAGEAEKAIRDAVTRSTATSGPDGSLGCFLSGGTDSSSVAGITGQSTRRPARTFSIGFGDERYNEIEYARVAARHFGTDHHEYFVKPPDVLELLPGAVAAYDEPFGNSSMIPSYYCARLAAESGVTHLLAGDGGDELFGGNQRYADDRVFQRYTVLPAWLRRGLIEPLASFAPLRKQLPIVDKACKYVRRSGMALPDRWHSYFYLTATPLQEVFAGDFLASLNGCDPLAPCRRHYQRAPANDDMNRWLYLDLKITITDNDLRKVTAMAELAGVEPRYPLLSPSLAEFSGTVPPHLKVRGTQLRYLFKKAMSGLLPPEILTKQKHGFGLPFSTWMGEYEPLRDFALDTLSSRACRERGYFHKDLIDRLWLQYQTVHRVYYGDILWLFLILEQWHVTQNDNRVARISQPART
jgi:asparagine synthase (glutamine-hydrolysing)